MEEHLPLYLGNPGLFFYFSIGMKFNLEGVDSAFPDLGVERLSI